jgi:hypothetical protein
MSLQDTINAAPTGSVISLDGVIEPNPVTVSKSHALVGSGHLQGGLIITGSGVVVRGGATISNWNGEDIVVVSGDYVTLDGVNILGDPVNGNKRGIAVFGSHIRCLNLLVDNIFRTDQDTQAIWGGDTPGPIYIDRCQLYGAGETVMFGGSDPSSPARVPTNVIIRRSLLSKRQAWAATASIKNGFELKNVRTLLFEENTVEYCWSNGQNGVILVITVRNQDGTAPYSDISEVVIRNNIFQHACGGINILGADDSNFSQRLARVLIQNNQFLDMNPVAWRGWNEPTDKLIQLNHGPTDLTIDNNTFEGQNLGSWLYFAGAPKSVNLNVTNNRVPFTYYGVIGDGCAPGASSWEAYVASGSCMNNTLPDGAPAMANLETRSEPHGRAHPGPEVIL